MGISLERGWVPIGISLDRGGAHVDLLREEGVSLGMPIDMSRGISLERRAGAHGDLLREEGVPLGMHISMPRGISLERGVGAHGDLLREGVGDHVNLLRTEKGGCTWGSPERGGAHGDLLRDEEMPLGRACACMILHVAMDSA